MDKTLGKTRGKTLKIRRNFVSIRQKFLETSQTVLQNLKIFNFAKKAKAGRHCGSKFFFQFLQTLIKKVKLLEKKSSKSDVIVARTFGEISSSFQIFLPLHLSNQSSGTSEK